MEWAVWDQKLDQGSRILYSNFALDSDSKGCEWQCGFYSGNGIDLIEENALNEKSCIQVLNVLISKAHAEILELEEDLIILQSQLAWADESWSETCSSALNGKIDCLYISLRSLENADVQAEHDFGDCLLFQREPAERMHQIVKPLLENYFHEEHEQNKCTIVKDFSSDASGQATDESSEKKDLSKFDFRINGKDGLTKHNCGSKERSLVGNPTLETVGKGRKFPRTVEASSSDASNHANSPEGKNKASRIGSKVDGCKEVEEHNSRDQSIIVKSPLQHGKNVLNISETVEYNQHDRNIKDLDSDASVQETDESSDTEKLSKFDLKIDGKDGVRNNNSASKKKRLVISSTLKTAGEGRILPRSFKPPSASSSDASKQADSPKGENKLSRIDSKVNEHKEVKGHYSTGQSHILKSSFLRKGRKSNISETPADHPVEFRSRPLHEVTEESGVNPKLCEGIDAAPTNNIEPPLSSFKIGKMRIKSPRKIESPGVGHTDTETKAVDSFVLSLDHKKEQKGKSRLAANVDESNSNLPGKPQKQREKRQFQQKQKATSVLDVDREKKRKLQSSLGVEETKKLKSLQISLGELCANTTESTNVEDLCDTKCDNETPKLLPSPTLPCPEARFLDLESLTVVDLRAIAKQHNMRGYSLLNKSKLTEELSLKLMVRGGCT